MGNERTFEKQEERLIAKALKDKAFIRPLPPGLAGKIAARARAAAARRRWAKAAASVAAAVSFAALAATVATIVLAPQDPGATGRAAAADDAAGLAAFGEEPFEKIFSEELEELKKQEERSVRAKSAMGVAAGAIAAATVFTLPSADGAVRSSVFDDVKVWYKGSAGNAVGTADSGNNQTCLVKNLPQLADSSSSLHGGEYYWWGWRMSYENQHVACPYANVTLASTPCMVVASPVTTNSLETVTIDGVEQTQPNITYRTGTLKLTKWFADRTANCENYTVFLRFRNEAINPLPGNQNRVVKIGGVWSGAAGAAGGVDLRMQPTAALSEYSVPRFVVGNDQSAQYDDVRIKDGTWVDCVIAVSGSTLTTTFCYEEDGVCVLKRHSKTYPATGPQPSVAPNAQVLIGGDNKSNCSFTRGVGVTSANGWTYGFRGAFHQIAFWDRTLSDDEIREAMACGTGRPNLVQVGIEGNGANEFAAAPSKASAATDGDWENLNPTLTAENPSAAITFDCPKLWAGLPQYLRLPMASASSPGAVDITLNGTLLGTAGVYPGKTSLIYIEENKIVSGANTLVIERTSGDVLVLDAVALGGSWHFGESISSFTDQASATGNPDRYLFSPACGSDEIHHRGLASGRDSRTYLDFYVPEDLAGKCRGVFATRVQNTGKAEKDFHFYANGKKVGEYKLVGGATTEVNIPPDAIVAGWNRLAWESQSGGDWANIDWHEFSVLPPAKGLMIIIK